MINIKSCLIFMVFIFISTSILCNADLDDSDEGLEIYEELENLTKTNLERGSNAPIQLTLNAFYTCDKNFNTITSTDNPQGAGALPFSLTRGGLACTSLTRATESGNYRGSGGTAGTQNINFNNLKTVILRFNGEEICTQTGTIISTGSCNGAQVFLYDTITQSANTDCKSVAGLTTQTTSTAVFIIKNGNCKCKCKGSITYRYLTPLRKSG